MGSFPSLLLCLLAGCQPTPAPTGAPPTPTAPPTLAVSPSVSADGLVTSPSGLQYQDREMGAGPRPTFNQTVLIRYTGWLADGKKIDSNLSEFKPPVGFKLGADA